MPDLFNNDTMYTILRQRLFEMESLQPANHVEEIDEGVLRIGFQYVILGFLDNPDRDLSLQKIDKLLEKVLNLRQQFTPAKASDIYLFLSTPSGSLDNPDWRNLATEIERDDRLARKQVWLPNADGSNFSDLINCSFLASLWDRHHGSVEELDLITDALELPPGWEDILMNETLSGESLVEALLELEMQTSRAAEITFTGLNKNDVSFTTRQSDQAGDVKRNLLTPPKLEKGHE